MVSEGADIIDIGAEFDAALWFATHLCRRRDTTPEADP